MSEERTGELQGGRSFEERVFARFDAIDRRFVEMDARLSSLDSRVERLEAKALDTKPIWERALAEILNVRKRVESTDEKFEILILDMMKLRGEQRGIKLRLQDLESKSA
jgi:hypothetical protein